MSYLQDTPYNLAPRTKSTYIISSQHRQLGNPNKSIWSIPYEEEIDCFILSKTSKWINGSVCWGLKPINNRLEVIGKNNDQEDLKIAKFVDGNKNNIWHGYPADCKRKKQDIPDTEILVIWKNKELIGKSDVRKLKQQMTCNL